jgi:hypothetical protein
MVVGKILQQLQVVSVVQVEVHELLDGVLEHRLEAYYYPHRGVANPIEIDIMWYTEHNYFLFTRKEYTDGEEVEYTITRFMVEGCHTLREVLNAMNIKIHRISISDDNVILDTNVVLDAHVHNNEVFFEPYTVYIWAEDDL